MEHHISVIGSGWGGYAAALEAARPGVRVTLIERAGIGGTCLNRGCIPTKTWRAAAEMFDRFNRSDDLGVIVKGHVDFDFPRLLETKRAVVETLGNSMLARLGNHGVRLIDGIAVPNGTGGLMVCHADGTTDELRPDSIILACGSGVAECPGLPRHEGKILSTDDALELRELPHSVLVVGGGANGCEFASIFAALDIEVILVEAAPRLLPSDRIDADISAALMREMKKRGITVHVKSMVDGADIFDDGVCTTLRPSCDGGGASTVTTDKVVVAAGRRPPGGLEEWKRHGLELGNDGWVKVNARLETGVTGVYAVGDVLGPDRPMLAHVAAMEGAAAAVNALGGSISPDYGAVPYTVFTIPEAAGVGLTELEARQLHSVVRSKTVHMRSLGRAHTSGDIAGFVKIVADGSGRILGVHIMGQHATELIAEGALALRMGATVADLASTAHAHPTFSEAIWEAARAFAESRGRR